MRRCGQRGDRDLAILLLVGAVAGVILFNLAHRRATHGCSAWERWGC